MTQLYGRKVALARFHEGFQVIGIGSVEKVLPASNKTLDVDMTCEREGVFVKIKTPRQTAYTELLVPWQMVSVATLAPEEPKKNVS